MGLTANGVTFLLHARASGVRFDRTATLGRQMLLASKALLQSRLERFGYADAEQLHLKHGAYAEPLLHFLGAESVRSFDVNDYEGATDIHDFNTPIGDAHKRCFSVVLDGGTLEHIFNFPVAIANALQMIEQGGHYIGISPTNNYAGHGFYQFSADLYFRVFSPENGFRIVKVFLFEERPSTRWYEVADPKVVKHRVTLVNRWPARLAVLAQRVALQEVFSAAPTQSGWQEAWQKPVQFETWQRCARAVIDIIPPSCSHAIMAVRAALLGTRGYRRIDPESVAGSSRSKE